MNLPSLLLYWCFWTLAFYTSLDGKENKQMNPIKHQIKHNFSILTETKGKHSHTRDVRGWLFSRSIFLHFSMFSLFQCSSNEDQRLHTFCLAPCDTCGCVLLFVSPDWFESLLCPNGASSVSVSFDPVVTLISLLEYYWKGQCIVDDIKLASSCKDVGGLLQVHYPSDTVDTDNSCRGPYKRYMNKYYTLKNRSAGLSCFH